MSGLLLALPGILLYASASHGDAQLTRADFLAADTLRVEVAAHGMLILFGNTITERPVRLQLKDNTILINGVRAYPSKDIADRWYAPKPAPGVVDADLSARRHNLGNAILALRDSLQGTMSQQEIIRRAVAFAKSHTSLVADAAATELGLEITYLRGATAAEQQPETILLFGRTAAERPAHDNARLELWTWYSVLRDGGDLAIGTRAVTIVSPKTPERIAAFRSAVDKARRTSSPIGPQTWDDALLPASIAEEIRDPVDLSRYKGD